MSPRRFVERIKQHGWFGVAVDLLVVVVGILLALRVDGWAQGRSDLRSEQADLRRLEEDLEIERARMDDAEEFALKRIEAAHFLNALLLDPNEALDAPAKVPWAIETVSWRSFPRINAYVYGEMQSSGRTVLIHSDSLRRSLAEHYTALQHDARVGEDLSAHQRFDAATAGLITVEELEALETAEGDIDKLDTTPARALAMARSFAQRPVAIAQLPNLVQHHTFNLRVIRQMRERSDAIVRQIDAQLGP